MAQTTPDELVELITRFRGALNQRGIRAGQRVMVASSCTRAMIMAAEFALLELGAIICPVQAQLRPVDFQKAYELLDPAFVVVADQETLKEHSLPSQADIISLSDLEIVDNPAPPVKAHPNDPALIILTSGTTGEMKGVVLSHANVLYCVLGVMAVVPLTHRHCVLSFLPTSHIFERIVIYAVLALKSEMHFATDARHARVLFPRVNPHFFTTVPRPLERAFQEFRKAAEMKGFFKRVIFEFSLKQASGESALKRRAARLIALRRLRRVFGRRLIGVFVGGAAMPVEIMKWYEAAGIKVREGYGMTECSGVASVNRFNPGEFRLGTTGLPMPGAEIRIDSANPGRPGEILLRSPGVMIGYLHNEESTRAVIDPDGWLHTGDVGVVEDGQFLRISGRKKVIFKNSFGEYVVPEVVEHELRKLPAVEDAMVLGLGRPYTSALIVPRFDVLESWCREQEIHWTSAMYMIYNPEVRDYYETQINDLNKTLPAHQRVMGFALVHEPWTAENGFVTPAFKLRRHALEEHYSKTIDNIYK